MFRPLELRHPEGPCAEVEFRQPDRPESRTGRVREHNPADVGSVARLLRLDVELALPRWDADAGHVALPDTDRGARGHVVQEDEPVPDELEQLVLEHDLRRGGFDERFRARRDGQADQREGTAAPWYTRWYVAAIAGYRAIGDTLGSQSQ